MAQNNREKDWDEYASSLQQENPHLDPPGYGGDALPSGSSSENVSQGESRFLTKLFQTVLANPVLDASQALKTPQERRAEFEAARRLQNQLGLDALEANRRVRAQRDAEYRRTGTEALRRLLEEAYGLDLGSGTPPLVSNADAPNLRLPDFPDLSEAIEAQMLRDLNTSAIAEQNRRFGKNTDTKELPEGNKQGNGVIFSIRTGKYLGKVGAGTQKIYLISRIDGASPDSDFAPIVPEKRGEYFVEKTKSQILRYKNAAGKVVEQILPPLYEVKTLELNKTDFINRARWIYGEGGEEIPDYYAHAIKNARKYGWSGLKPFDSEAAMMKAKMITNRSNYDAFIDGTYDKDGAYGHFFRTQTDLKNLMKEIPSSAAIFLAIIQAELGLSEDPSNGAIAWLGSGSPGATNPDGENKYILTIPRITDSKGYNHYFHKFGLKQK